MLPSVFAGCVAVGARVSMTCVGLLPRVCLRTAGGCVWWCAVGGVLCLRWGPKAFNNNQEDTLVRPIHGNFY